MPFVTRAQAARRASRRKTRQQLELERAQSQYKQNIFGAQSDLQTAQSQAANEFATLSEEYETGLTNYRDRLTDYNARADEFAKRVGDYVNRINEIERATDQNTLTSLYNMNATLVNAFGPRDYVDVPQTPDDPGSFTETFDMQAPTAPVARSIEPEIQRFEQRAAAEKDVLEREIGERKAGSLRARRRMTDRTMLQRS
jgi:hypothetical protein